jgi:cell division protein FtsI/penicillin-binding protein 2
MHRIPIWLLAVGLVGMATTAATTTAKKVRPSPGPSDAKQRAGKKKRASKRKLPPLPAVDPTVGDNVDGDDLPVRRAAVEALGNYNGSVAVVDPDSGRVLTIVNQRLAYKGGFVPCSTIKLVTALAALSEGLVERETPVRLNRRISMNLTTALAHSNNPYFAILGSQLGFDRVCRYARMFGLGEKAGLDIPGEQPGLLPEEPPANGGVGMMTSFGEGFAMTPLELASLVSVISNGGTLYYLQYPRSQREIDDFTPRVKRSLEIHPWINDVKIGMRAAVEFGTARRAGYENSEPILGKTGTCTDFRSANHMGWFASFNDAGHHRLVVVVMLTGGHPVNGPVAAGVAGQFYRLLSTQNYFAGTNGGAPRSLGILATQSCCAR